MIHFLFTIIFLVLNGCSTTSKQNEAKTNQVLVNPKVKSFIQTFKSEKEAMEYALDRRLSIQRFHQLGSEPYFGTPAQKKCENNIDIKGEIITVESGKYFYFKLLANDYLSLGDCLKENNTQEAYYEFYICKNGVVIEQRIYQPYNSPAPKLRTKNCETI